MSKEAEKYLKENLNIWTIREIEKYAPILQAYTDKEVRKVLDNVVYHKPLNIEK